MKIRFVLVLIFILLSVVKGECMNLASESSSPCAVVLYSGGKYAMETKFTVFTVKKEFHKKIHIINEEGLKYRNLIIPYYRFPEYSENVGGIRISVLNKDGNNVRNIDKENTLDINLDGNCKEKRIFIPDISVGDTIDIKYEIVGVFPQYYELQQDSTSNMDDFGFMTRKGSAEDIIFPKWRFQEDIPVLKSELEFVYFEDYIFDAVLTGGEKVTKEENSGGVYRKMNRSAVKRKHYTLSNGTAKNIIPGIKVTGIVKENINSHMSAFKGAYTEKNVRKMRFSASNLPALVKTDEKYIINPQKYKVAVEFDFKGKHSSTALPEPGIGMNFVASNSGGDYTYCATWTDVSKVLFNSRFFGSKIFYMQNFYKDYTDSVNNLSLQEYDKVKMICDHIKNDLRCDYQNGGMFISNPRETYINKRGTNVDICAIAYKALQKSGYNAKMVMLKSRDAGLLSNSGISMGALNSIVVHVALKDGRFILFDPTGNPSDANLINPMYLVREGIVYGEGERKINLMNAVENKEYHNATLHVDSKGMVNGVCKSYFTNHSAYGMYGVQPEPNGELISCTSSALDSTSSRFSREFEYRSTSSIAVDDKIFINPFAENFFNVNDLSDNRVYPVEFRNPRIIEYTAVIHIPDGYEAYDLPQNNSIQQNRTGAKATILSKAHENIVLFGLTIELNNATIPMDQYGVFHEWWQQMCSLYDTMLVFRKSGGKSFTDTEKMTLE